jgi:folate-dependent phosphoribosylglycinamide formyltransferase PurN
MAVTKIKKIVFVGHDNEGSARLFDKIAGEFPRLEFLMVIGQGLYYRKSLLGSVIKLLREASWIFCAFRFIDLIRYRLTGETVTKKCRAKGIPVIFTRDINSQETIRKIQDFGPDLLISLFTMQIYQAPVLRVAKYGSITCHPSLLPEYRGLEVFFWVLANDEKQTGVSVFFLTEKIDAGMVFEQQVIPLAPEITVAGLYRIIADVGGALLVKAIGDIDSGKINYIAQERNPSYYPMPDGPSVRRFFRLKKRFY